MSSRRACAALALLATTAACGPGPGGTAVPVGPSEPTDNFVANGSLGGRRPFPADNPWNTDISGAPVGGSQAWDVAVALPPVVGRAPGDGMVPDQLRGRSAKDVSLDAGDDQSLAPCEALLSTP